MIPEPDYREDDNNKNNNNRLNTTSTTSSTVPLRHQRSGSPTNHKSNGSNGSASNGHSHALPNFDEDGLIIPRKLINPCVDSHERKSVHKEMLWNQKVGKNVLNSKNELEKELAKRKDNQKKRELEAEKLSRRSSLERRLEEQQLKIRQHEGNGDSQPSPSASSSSPDKQPLESEFLKIYSKVKCATNTDNNNDNNNCVLKTSATPSTPPMTASKT